MNKTILIGSKYKLSKTALITLRIVNGITIILWGVFFIKKYDFNPYELIFLSLIILASTAYIFYIFIIYSKNSKWSPKMKVNDTEILLKNSLWRNSLNLKWADISLIKFEPYKIVFNFQDTSTTFSYKTNPDVSREIKQTIREFSSSKNIEVIGG